MGSIDYSEEILEDGRTGWRLDGGDPDAVILVRPRPDGSGFWDCYLQWRGRLVPVDGGCDFRESEAKAVGIKARTLLTSRYGSPS